MGETRERDLAGKGEIAKGEGTRKMEKIMANFHQSALSGYVTS